MRPAIRLRNSLDPWAERLTPRPSCASSSIPANRALVAHGQLVAALGAAASQDGPGIRSLHPDTEAMRLGAMTIIWLERTFRHSESCFLSLLVWERQPASPPG